MREDATEEGAVETDEIEEDEGDGGFALILKPNEKPSDLITSGFRV